MRIEMEALIAVANNDPDAAIEAMKKATAIAESMEPPSGPPGEAATDAPIKPPHELFGEILMAEGKYEEALAQFETSLLRTPNRVRSLLGAARAAEKVGNEKIARRSYEAIAHIAGAGPDLPGLDEARKYIESSTSEDR
jgi:tetratricopeptide (TPR) repeat protein